jgi:hypothetical protein
MKKVFWSAALNPAADAGRPEEADQSHVPPVLRSLRKCEACGFPVSAGRALCVECEEKKWRGHLKLPQMVAPLPIATPASRVAEKMGLATSGAEPLGVNKGIVPVPEDPRQPQAALSEGGTGASVVPAAKPEAAFAAAASIPVRSTPPAATSSVAIPALRGKESKDGARQPIAAAAAASMAVRETVTPTKAPSSEFVLSAGLEPLQSWLSANKYMIGALLVIGVVVAAVFLLR